MSYFPKPIAQGMRKNGAMTTCVPVQFDNAIWQTAVFFEIGGKECKEDRRFLRKANTTVAIAIEADLINHANASVVMLRFEVMTQPQSPLVGEVLLTPGLGEVQFDTIKYLSEQQQIRWFFGDSAYQIIHTQQTSLRDQERAGYAEILQEAISHDALLRMTGKYDANKAIDEVVSNYAFKK